MSEGQEQILKENLRLKESLQKKLKELAQAIAKIEAEEGVSILANLAVDGGAFNDKGVEVREFGPAMFSYVNRFGTEQDKSFGLPPGVTFPHFINTLDISMVLSTRPAMAKDEVSDLIAVTNQGYFQRLTGIQGAPWLVVYNGALIYPDIGSPDPKLLQEIEAKMAQDRTTPQSRTGIEDEELPAGFFKVPLRGGGSMPMMSIPPIEEGETEEQYQERLNKAFEELTSNLPLSSTNKPVH